MANSLSLSLSLSHTHTHTHTFFLSLSLSGIYCQMAGFLGRFPIAVTAVGGAAIIGGYLYTRQGIHAGAAPGQLSFSNKSKT